MRRAWQPAPGILPGEAHGKRNLVGYSQWGHKDSDVTEHEGEKEIFLNSASSRSLFMFTLFFYYFAYLPQMSGRGNSCYIVADSLGELCSIII